MGRDLISSMQLKRVLHLPPDQAQEWSRFGRSHKTGLYCFCGVHLCFVCTAPCHFRCSLVHHEMNSNSSKNRKLYLKESIRTQRGTRFETKAAASPKTHSSAAPLFLAAVVLQVPLLCLLAHSWIASLMAALSSLVSS